MSYEPTVTCFSIEVIFSGGVCWTASRLEVFKYSVPHVNVNREDNDVDQHHHQLRL